MKTLVVVALSIVSCAIIFVVGWLFREAGVGFCFGGVFGILFIYCWFRLHYGWWPDFDMDGEDEKNATLPRISAGRVGSTRLRVD